MKHLLSITLMLIAISALSAINLRKGLSGDDGCGCDCRPPTPPCRPKIPVCDCRPPTPPCRPKIPECECQCRPECPVKPDCRC